MSRRLVFGLPLLVIAVFLEACGQTTPLLPSTPISNETSCGVGLFDHNVRIWIEGRDAQEICRSISALIRQQGNQPTGWDGRISESVSDYQPVCSDALPTFSYEVVDTGGHSYGTEWCQWIVQGYGVSGSVTAPDLMGIISEAQQAENAQLRAEDAAYQATEESRRLIYATACRQHNGYIDNGFCVVDYPGWPLQPVTINADGTWDAAQADINREDCDIAMQDAAASAQDGQPWSTLPQYHSDTGVCVPGNP